MSHWLTEWQKRIRGISNTAINPTGSQPSTLCKKCLHLQLYHAILSPVEETDSANEGQDIRQSAVTNWYETLYEIKKSSDHCSLCFLVMKGWREHRKSAVEQEALDQMIEPSFATDAYKDIADIKAYRGSRISVSVALDRDENMESLSPLIRLRFECEPVGTRNSWNPIHSLMSSFRLILINGLLPQMYRRWSHC
jgi:hypothetical protein